MVILHTTNCPKCKILKKKLDDAQIEYKSNYDTEKMIDLGFLEAPILQVNSEFYKFPEAINWVNAQKG